MRVGLFELELVNETHEPYPERVIGNRTYVEGVANSSYHVKATVYKDKDGAFPAGYLRVGLIIDGKELFQTRKLDLKRHLQHHKDEESVTRFFFGFPKALNVYQSFLFNVPEMCSDANITPNLQLGSVQMVVEEAQPTGNMRPMIYTVDSELPEHQRIREDKDFRLQASLGTAAGKVVVESRNNASSQRAEVMSEKWVSLGKLPQASLRLCYHSAAMLDFLEFEYAKERTINLVSDAEEEDAGARQRNGAKRAAGSSQTNAGYKRPRTYN